MIRAFLSALVLTWAAGAALAQTYPDKPVRVFMPGAPGGSFDTMVRVVTNRLAQELGQPFVVENYAGAGGMISVERCLKAAADGYNVCVTYTGNLAIAPYIYKKMSYDPVKDLKPVALLGGVSYVLAVPQSSPFHSVAELLKYAQDNPGKMTYASGGNGTGGHVAGEMIKAVRPLSMIHVPHQGNAPASIALLGGQVDWAFEALPTALPNVKAGKLRPLAVSTLKRLPELPDVPTMAESGFPGFDLTSWVALSAPAGTPNEPIQRLVTAINKVLKEPEVKEGFMTRGAQTLGGTPEQFASFLQSELKLYERVMGKAKAD